MVDGDDTGVLTLGLRPEAGPNDVTTVIPAFFEEDVEQPWVEPRRYVNGRPDWSTTDEIYITYDKEGERAVVTTGELDIWNAEHSYQRTGSGRYDALRDLGSRVGGRAVGVVRRLAPIIPGRGDTRLLPQVDADPQGDDAGAGPGGGAGGHPANDGDGHARSHRYSRDHPDGRRVPERTGAEERVRSHRHCPGCAGHGRADRSPGELVLRGVAAWILGWFLIWGGGFGVSFGQYVFVTAFAFVVAVLWRPVWREITGADDRYAKGGRR